MKRRIAKQLVGCVDLLSSETGVVSSDIESLYRELHQEFNSRLFSVIDSREHDLFKDQTDFDKQLQSAITETDLFRVLALPTTFVQINTGIYLDDAYWASYWKDSLYHLYILWILLTIHDKNTDGEVVDSLINNSSELLMGELPWDLRSRVLSEMRNSGIKDNLDRSTISTYTYTLALIYSNYGNYISRITAEINPKHKPDCACVSTFFSSYLIITKLLDDIADWNDDYENNEETYLSIRLRSSVSNESGELATKTVLTEILYVTYYLRGYLAALRKQKYVLPRNDIFTRTILDLIEDEQKNLLSLYREL